jgi:hypothetical protein
MITKYHPAYKKSEVDDKKKEEVIKEAPPSLHNFPGGDKGSAGWTNQKIDDLDEFELTEFKTKNPDLYDKYLKGFLK